MGRQPSVEYPGFDGEVRALAEAVEQLSAEIKELKRLIREQVARDARVPSAMFYFGTQFSSYHFLS